MLTTLFLILAAIGKAVADTLAHHFSTSVFKSKNPNFWDPNESWKHAKKVFSYPVDAWHLSNSFMIVAMILAVVFYQEMVASKWIEIGAFGGLFVITFNMFYNHTLRRK